MRLGKNRKEAVDESLRVNLQPVFMTAITTAIGFLTMHFSEAPPFRQLGYMMSFGNLVLFFHAVVTLPALLVIIPSKMKKTGYSKILKMIYINWCKKNNFSFVTGHVRVGIAKQFSDNTEIVKIFSKWYSAKTPFEYYRRPLK